MIVLSLTFQRSRSPQNDQDWQVTERRSAPAVEITLTLPNQNDLQFGPFRRCISSGETTSSTCLWAFRRRLDPPKSCQHPLARRP